MLLYVNSIEKLNDLMKNNGLKIPEKETSKNTRETFRIIDAFKSDTLQCDAF